MEVLKSSWWLIINIGYLVLILMVAFFLFTVPAQSDDFVYAFTQDFEPDYVLAVYLALPFWCGVTWYSACVILQIDPTESSLGRGSNPVHLKLSLIVPKVIGIIPCLILFVAIAMVPNVTQTHYQLIHMGGLSVMTIIMWGLFTLQDHALDTRTTIRTPQLERISEGDNPYLHPKGFVPYFRYLFSVRTIGKWPTFKEVDRFKYLTGYLPTIRQEMIFIAQFKSVKLYFVLLGSVAFILTALFCFPALNLYLSSWLRPASILILSISSLTLLFTIIFYFHDYRSRPFGVVLLFWVVVISYWNDNTRLVYIENDYAKHRASLDTAFAEWLDVKRTRWKESHGPGTMPVIFVATQGGGIRALNWTTRTLHYLDSAYKGFIDQTFLISGVSGGGVGAVAYLSFLHDLKAGRLPGDNPDSLFKKFTQQDFLSPLTASLAFGDNLQKFIPWPVSSLERSKILGKTWEKYYERIMASGTFSGSFLGMWYDDENKRYSLPTLMLNGTLAENGQRVITSNVEVGSGKWFYDDVDFFSISGRDISLSFAALNCSRFPFVTSGGLLESGEDRKGHIVDGGYRENTGLQTVYNVYKTIENELNASPRDSVNARILILYLQNGEDELQDKAKASRLLHDAITPVNGVINVNGTMLTAKAIVQLFHQSFDFAYPPNVEFHVMSLEEGRDSRIKLPLGWYMSDTVSQAIDRRVRRIGHIDTTLVRSLGKLFNERKTVKPGEQ